MSGMNTAAAVLALLERRVRDDGDVSVRAIAAARGQSPSTLLRHLRAEGARFNRLREEARWAAVRSITDAALGWTAGILDGEGHVSLRHRPAKRSYSAVVTVNNTDLAMILRLRELWGGYIYTCPLDRPWHPARSRQVHRWIAGSWTALRVLEMVRPHLVTKRTIADLVIGLQRRVHAQIGRIHTRVVRGRFSGWALTEAELEIRSRMLKECRRLNERGRPIVERTGT
jgi:hypothetical protein